MTKRGVSSIIPSIYDCSGHIALYILKGKSILSRIWAYEKVVSPKLEEVTSHDKAEILLAQFKESERSPDTGNHTKYQYEVESGKSNNAFEKPRDTGIDDSPQDMKPEPDVYYQYEAAGGKPPDPPVDMDPNMKSIFENMKSDDGPLVYMNLNDSPNPNMKPDSPDPNQNAGMNDFALVINDPAQFYWTPYQRR